MDRKTTQNESVKTIFERFRDRLAALQEAQFDKGEKELKALLDGEDKKTTFPVPTFALSMLIWGFILFFPLLLILDPSVPFSNTVSLRNMADFYVPLIATLVIFLANQRFLVRRCFFKKRYFLFICGNAILLVLSLLFREFASFLIDKTPEQGLIDFFASYCFSSGRGHITVWTIFTFILILTLICFLCILINLVSRQLVRSFLLRETKRASLQYELDFLRNQLSPHFLFNTLNNISALISIDPRKAEKSMTELSSLLRITLYQTTDKFIPLSEEIEILQKYANLEKLRLDDNYDFVFDINVKDLSVLVAPLLAMPILENAMKHSINPSGKSFAHISMEQNENELLFIAENSNFPRKSSSKASGLGLAVMKKRLELIYAGRYEYTSEIKDGVYRSVLKIRVCD